MENYLDHYRDKTVLITGGAGSIGTNLTRAIAELGAKLVIVLDDMSAAYEWNVPNLPNLLLVKGSVVDEDVLKRVFVEKPDIVFHLAAFFANQNSVDYPARDLAVNGLGTLRVLEYSTMYPIERVVYASSGCSIYGSTAPLPLTEDFTSMHLTTPYQITKMLGELYANFFWHHHDLPIVKTRFFNSYGPGEVPGQYRNVIPNFIYWAMSGQALPITGTGEETRDFTYVGDIVDALLRAGYVEKAIGEEMNIASGTEVAILDLAESINGLVDNKAGIKPAQPRIWDTKKRLLASIERARDVLGYEPETAFDEGLEHTVDWFRANWDDIHASADFPPGMFLRHPSRVEGTCYRQPSLLAERAAIRNGASLPREFTVPSPDLMDVYYPDIPCCYLIRLIRGRAPLDRAARPSDTRLVRVGAIGEKICRPCQGADASGSDDWWASQYAETRFAHLRELGSEVVQSSSGDRCWTDP